MGRELRRKEERRNIKNKDVKRKDELDTSIKKGTVLKVVVFSALMLLVLYYVVAVFITKEINISWINDNEASENNAGVERRILAQNIFNQSEDSYYVYFYDFSDEDASISGAVDRSDLTVYRVDTGSALNQNYVTEEVGNPSATNLDDLRVTNPTLIKVESDKIVAYYDTRSEILAVFN